MPNFVKIGQSVTKILIYIITDKDIFRFLPRDALLSVVYAVVVCLCVFVSVCLVSACVCVTVCVCVCHTPVTCAI